ncbi:MAG: type IV secretory system conjugative DNA transfer family protein [Bacilli bacterium]
MNYARWSTKEELLKVLKEIDINSSIQKSGIPMCYDKNKIYIKDDNSHTLVIGAPGSGKTQAVMLPQVKLAIKANESFFINDVKGEILEKVGGELKKQNYNIIVLDYANLEKGNHYNILDFPYYLYANNNKDKAIQMLEEIGFYLLHDSNDTSDIFWENTAIEYFIGLVLYLFDHAKKEEINLNSVFALSSQINDNNNEKVINNLDKNSSTYQYLANTLTAPLETKHGIVVTFSQRIKTFITKENLSSMMSISDFDITNIDKEKTAIFVISGISNYANTLISILLEQIFYSIQMYDNKDNRFNLIIDEFDSLMPIKDFYGKLNYARGINIRVTAFIKNLTNLNNIYGNKNKDLIRMCFDNIIYLLANDLYTLEEISKLCGDTGRGPLISIEELKTMDYFNEIILMPRMMPIKTKIKPDYEIEWNMDKSIIDVPKLSIEKANIFNLK